MYKLYNTVRFRGGVVITLDVRLKRTRQNNI